MEKQLKYELMEYSSSLSEAIYLRKPLSIEELKRTYPNLKGIVFEFGRSAFEPLRYDHQTYMMAVLQAFDFQEVSIDSAGRLTHLPDTLWKSSLKKLELSRHNCNFPVQPPPGFKNNLDAIALRNSDYIDPAILDTPTLRYVDISAYKGDLSRLANAVNLEKLMLSDVKVNNIDFSRFTQLKHLQFYSLQQTEYLPDFSALRNLRELRMSVIPQLRAMPSGLEKLSNLETLVFQRLGNSEWPKMHFPFYGFPNLEKLEISNGHFDYATKETMESPENRAKWGLSGVLSKVLNRDMVAKNERSENLPALKTLTFIDSFAQSLPEWMLAPSLEQCWVIAPELQQLPATFWQCTELKHLNVSCNSMADFGTGWTGFSNLESFSFETSHVCSQLPDFGRANTALNTISLKTAELSSLPESWRECPALQTININAKPCELPAAWADFPALNNLKIRWTDGGQIFIRKEMALLPNLQALRLECQSLPGRDMKLVQTLNATLTKFQADTNTRLVFGHLLLENPKNAPPYTDAFKTDFLQAVNIGSGPLKQVIWDNLHLLNPNQVPFSTLRQFENKSLFIAGGTRLKKGDYKEKLEAMGIKIVTKFSADVDIILLGNACPDLSEGFWSRPHWFCGEGEMDKVLKEYQPGFMQTLPENDLDALRRLIWSNDPANERVVLEMLKKGGIPDAVIPDLVVVAKTSGDPNVRNDFRKLLKATAPEGLRAILSDTRDLDKVIERARYAYRQRPVGLSQVVVAHYHRSRNKALLPAFFRYRESLDNPYRTALFQDYYASLLQRPHYLSFMEILLSKDEWNQILNEPVLQGALKRLMFRCAGDELPDALFKHTTLNELKIVTDVAHLPEAIGDLKRLKILEVSGKNLRSAPDSLMQIKTLKSLVFCSSLSRENWEISEALQAARGGNHWMQQRGFDYWD